MMHHHAAAFRAAPPDLRPVIATLALRMAMQLPPALIAITYQPTEPIHRKIWVPLDPFGPLYPNLGATVAKLRRGDDRRAHGLAVLEAVRSLQQQSLARETPGHACPCASGTWHSDGNAILKHVRNYVVAATRRDADAERRNRSPETWHAMYADAIAEKGKPVVQCTCATCERKRYKKAA